MANNFCKPGPSKRRHSSQETQAKPQSKNPKIDIEERETLLSPKDLGLNCPICYNLPSPTRIYGCANGHHVCQTCHKQITQCPICLDEFIDCRQLVLEKILRNIDTPGHLQIQCRNKDCHVFSTQDDINIHENICDQRELTCPKNMFELCKFKGNRQELNTHNQKHKCFAVQVHPESAQQNPLGLATFEPNTVFTGNVDEFPTQKKDGIAVLSPTMLFSRKTSKAGLMALLVTWLNGTYLFTVQCLAPKEITEKWSVSITVGNGETESPTYMFTGKPVNQDMNLLEAYTSGQCLSINNLQAKAFSKPNSKHLFAWAITLKLEENYEKECLQILHKKLDKTHGKL